MVPKIVRRFSVFGFGGFRSRTAGSAILERRGGQQVARPPTLGCSDWNSFQEGFAGVILVCWLGLRVASFLRFGITCAVWHALFVQRQLLQPPFLSWDFHYFWDALMGQTATISNAHGGLETALKKRT